jgi:hypothetical protein
LRKRDEEAERNEMQAKEMRLQINKTNEDSLRK